MKITQCPQCGHYTHVMSDEIDLHAIDCEHCGHNMVWRTEEDVDLNIISIATKPDVTDDDVASFLDFLDNLGV